MVEKLGARLDIEEEFAITMRNAFTTKSIGCGALFLFECFYNETDSNPASSMLHCNGVNSDEGNNPDDQSREEHNDVSENTPDDQSNSASNASIDIVPKAILHSCANEQLGKNSIEYRQRAKATFKFFFTLTCTLEHL